MQSKEAWAVTQFDLQAQWSTPDLLALIRLAAANLTVFDRYLQTNLWLKLLYWCKHHLFPNTLKRSRQNVHEHYDLGNDFYRLWLDPGMSYSAAWFEGRDARGAAELLEEHYR